jgi:hypothetical protein
MKHVEVTHNLSLIYEALKTNKAAWDKFDTEIKALKATDSAESNKKVLWDITVQQAQVYAVIVLLTNSMIEALANCYLAEKCDQEQFEALEHLNTLDKLVVVPKLLIKEYEFPKGEALYCDLKHLLTLRKSIVHPKPRIIVNGQTIHKGNLAKKVSTSTLTPDKCISLPVRLVEHLCLYDHGGAFGLCIYSGFSKKATEEIILKVRAKSLKQHTSK